MKADYPILEFDPDEHAVIEPTWCESSSTCRSLRSRASSPMSSRGCVDAGAKLLTELESAHGVNPLQNPEVALDGYVRGRYSRPYRDRSQDLPGMIHADDVVVRLFAAIGWSWGGEWSSMKDYMHFSLTET